MGLRNFLNLGKMVVGSAFDGKVKPLGDMSLGSQKREGYTDKNGFWTDRGYDRATTSDYKNLEQSRKAFAKRNK